jgi:HSP20 family molecular chaperone IbpA
MNNENLFEEMQRGMDEVLCNMYGAPNPVLVCQDHKGLAQPTGTGLWRAPRCEMLESDNSFKTLIELPGVDKKDIELNITDKAMEVKVEGKEEKESKSKNGYSLMSARQSFYRMLALPRSVDSSKVKAEYHNGILTVEFPKSASSKAKRIEIK